MRRAVLGLTFLSLASPASAAVDIPTIVVTGKRLSDLKDDLARCRSRGCDPADDMRLSLAIAEAQFVNGSYRDARASLKDSLQRYPAAAAQHPSLVASLHRASARISQHYGDRDALMESSFAIGHAMQAAYPEDSPQVFFARLEAADMMVSSQIDGDRIGRTYDNLASQAKRMGDVRYVHLVVLRRAWFDALSGKTASADERLARVIAEAAPNMKLAANVVRLRIADRRGNDKLADSLMKDVVAEAGSQVRPQLVTNVPIQLNQSAAPVKWGNTDLASLGVREHDKASIASPESGWIDVGFWITPEGRVEDPEVLRPAQPKWWHGRVLEAVSRRQYTPYEAINGQPAAYRVERFTLTSSVERAVGSRLARRDTRLFVKSLDLTP